MKEGIFFIAVIPDEEIQEEVTRFKAYAAEYFESAHALRSPPHITIFPPFKWRIEKVGQLQEALQEFAAGEAPFSIGLKGFDCFAPRVIFVDVIKNEALNMLQNRLKEKLSTELKLQSRDQRPFHPHMTIAFKDLKRKKFPEAWAYFRHQTYERLFAVDHVSLLRHNGKRWEIMHHYPLGKG